MNCVRWATQSQRLASASDDNLALIWILKPRDANRQFGNLEEKQVENWRLLGRLQGHSHGTRPTSPACCHSVPASPARNGAARRADVIDLAWAPDETQLATCSLDNCVMVWDVERLERIATLRHTSMVKGVAWDPMGKYISSASDDKSVAIWRCADWRQEHKVDQPYQKEGRTFFRRLSWSPDGVYIATSHGYKDPQHISPLLRRTKDFAIECDFVGHQKAIISARFNPVIFKPQQNASGHDKHYTCVAIGSQDHSFSVWVASQVRPILVSQQFFGGSVLDISWGHDGYTLMCCAYDGSVVLFKFDEAELGTLVDEDERQNILTSLYGGASNLSGRSLSEIPESADQLHSSPGDSGSSKKPWPDENSNRQSQPVNILPTRSKAPGGSSLAAAARPKPAATGGAAAAMASTSQIGGSRPGASAVGGLSSTSRPQLSSAAAAAGLGAGGMAVHQPPVRKGGKAGKRRIAPVLISPNGADSSSSSAFATASMQGAEASGGNSNASAKRPRTSQDPSRPFNGGAVSSPQSQAARQLQGNRTGQLPLAPQQQPQPQRQTHAAAQGQQVMVVADGRFNRPAVAAVAAATAGPGESFIREIGQAPHILLVESTAAAATAPAAAGGGASTSTIRVSKGSDVEWEDTVHNLVSAVGGDCSDRGFLAVGCTDGSVYTYTRRGRRLLPCMCLGGGGVAIVDVKSAAESESSSLLVVTVDGSLYLWSFKAGGQPKKLLKTSLAPLLSGGSGSGTAASPSLCLSRALVTKSGVVVAVLSNGHAFGFDTTLEVWLRLADDHFHQSDFHSDLPAAALGGSTNDQNATATTTDLATVHAAAATAARAATATSTPASRVAALMQAGGAARKKRSLAHLESLLGSAVLLGRGAVEGSGPAAAAAQQEYKDWLRVYARRLAEDGAVSGAAIAKVRELCEDLLGPPSSRSSSGSSAGASAAGGGGDSAAVAGDWEAMTALGLSKRALLKEVVLPTVAAHSRISGFQRLVSEYKLELETVDDASSG